MTAPLFRPLTPGELRKLTPEQYVEYLNHLIEHIHAQVEDTKKSIERREAWLKNRDERHKKPTT